MARGQWLRQKANLYREAKRLSQVTGIPHPAWRTSSARQLQQFLTVNASQERFIQRRQQRQQVQRAQRIQRRQRRRIPIALSRSIRRGRDTQIQRN